MFDRQSIHIAIRDFGTRPVASFYPDGPKTFMIAERAAKDIFSSYLF